MYLNRLTLIGFTGGDAETKTGNNGSTFTVFSVATKRSWKNADGEWNRGPNGIAASPLGNWATSPLASGRARTSRSRASFAAANTTKMA